MKWPSESGDKQAAVGGNDLSGCTGKQTLGQRGDDGARFRPPCRLGVSASVRPRAGAEAVDQGGGQVGRDQAGLHVTDRDPFGANFRHFGRRVSALCGGTGPTFRLVDCLDLRQAASFSVDARNIAWLTGKCA